MTSSSAGALELTGMSSDHLKPRTLRRQSSSSFVRKPLPKPIFDDDDLVAELNEPIPQEQWSNQPTTALYQSIAQNQSDRSDTTANPAFMTASDEPFQESTTSPLPSLERHLSLADMLAIGIGGTIGSGLFALAGLVAHEYAGPSTVLSWAVSGLAACISGACYAELSARVPLPGSAYAYAFAAMGELPALIAAACLLLEYIAASAAVARSWGDKCAIWLIDYVQVGDWIEPYIHPSHTSISPLAFIIGAVPVALLLHGIQESKRVTNTFTVLKVSLVAFMIVAGFAYTKSTQNWTPFFPMGVAGVLRGATGTFFGYLGYDQVCCLGGEASQPKRNLPRAILLTLVCVAVLYMVATLALTGMQNWKDISSVSGFPVAFTSVGANWAAQITAIGEIITLPIVVLVTTMALPRLLFAMAQDGLLPPIFRELDSKGNLWKGTFIGGGLMVIVATLVPFENLNDMISCAVLTALSMSDTSLILLWHESPNLDSRLADLLAVSFHVLAMMTSVLVTNYSDAVPGGRLIAFVGFLCMAFCVFGIWRWCPRASTFGGRRHQHFYHGRDLLGENDGYFRTPWVPVLPFVGIFINWYLIAQLNLVGIASLLGFLLLTTCYYYAYAAQYSVGSSTGWEQELLIRNVS